MASKSTASNVVVGNGTLPPIAEDNDGGKKKESPKEDTKASAAKKQPPVAAAKSASPPPAEAAASSEEKPAAKMNKAQSMGSVVPPKRSSGALGGSSLHMQIVNKIRADFAVNEKRWAQEKADLEATIKKLEAELKASRTNAAKEATAKIGALEGTVESMKKNDEENRAKIKELEDAVETLQNEKNEVAEKKRVDLQRAKTMSTLLSEKVDGTEKQLAEQKRVHEERVQALETELAESRDQIQKYENSEAALGYEVSSLTEQLAAARQQVRELRGGSEVTAEPAAETEPIAGAPLEVATRPTSNDAYHLMVDDRSESKTDKMPKKCWFLILFLILVAIGGIAFAVYAVRCSRDSSSNHCAWAK